jgi:AcrR family transcriptional regulator
LEAVLLAPRAYRSEKRQLAAGETRARIIAAAGELMTTSDNPLGFSIDAVAREADVARMTVYHQFQSKRGLFDAISDDLATRGPIASRIGAAMQRADALDALDTFIAAFAHFWSINRATIRRLDAIAAIDTEIGRGNHERNERRREGLRRILERVAAQYGAPSLDSFDETVDLLHTLTSFATFDGLAGSTRTPEEVIPAIQRLVRLALSSPASESHQADSASSIV